jgi:hypothetical protein
MGKQPSRKAARKAAAPPRASGRTAPVSDQRLITIRAQDANKKPIDYGVMRSMGPAILTMAMRWAYTLRVRSRWAGDPDMRDYFGTEATGDLGKLGIAADAVQRLALATHIEIELHKWEKAGAEAALIVDAASEIPWEYLLSAATRSAGRFQSLLVTRCLSNGSRVLLAPPQRVLLVESAPGRIDDEYEFEDEERRIRAAVNANDNKSRMEIAPTLPLSKLKERIKARNWEAIHVTGVDTHQAAWLIEGFYDAFEKNKTDVIDESDCLQDGMILRGDSESELPVRFDQLAPILLASSKPPRVVTLNLFYSGARTARELVRMGAHAAIGFLDEIDDEFAERFFQAFYWAWCHNESSIPDAFLNAWQTMDSDRMHGTGIVIWMGSSMVDFEATQMKKGMTKSATKMRSGTR